MPSNSHTRDEALQLLLAHTKSESLIRHAKCVEACMKHYATKLSEDVELWGNTGLLHDLDYELHPDEHPLVSIELLTKEGWPQPLIDAIAAHYEAKTGKAPVTPLDRHLIACDEMSGFIVAVTYVRPSKDIRDVEVKSVKKKLKTLAFAAAVDRNHLLYAADLIETPMDDHIAEILGAMQSAATELGLDGIS